MKKLTLTEPKKLADFLKSIAENSVKDAKKTLIKEDLFNSKDSKEEKPEETPAPSKETTPTPAPAEPAKTEKAPLPAADDVTLEMIVTRVNSIRSGKSLKDEQVSVQMKHYFDNLPATERLALMTFLTGISDIVTADATAEAAPEPEDVDLKTKQSAEPAPNQQVKKKSEDTSAPIVPGQKQTTESIRRKIRELL